ncbi:MAG: YIP1 family protein [Acidimicrobiia bacterium]
MSFLRNVLSAVLLDVEFYNRAEQDQSLARQAGVVVAIATTLSGIGSAIATESNVFAGAAIGLIVGLVGWVIWSGLSLVIGTKLFGGTSDMGEMLRVVGFSFAPLAFGIVPWLGLVGAGWALVAAVVGVREGMDFSTGRSIFTMAIGWGVWLALSIGFQVALGLEIKPIFPF